MENTDIKILTNEKTFKNLINDKNREKFFDEFIEEDEMTKYIIDGLGNDLILSKKQLITMLKTSNVVYEIINPYEGYAILLINSIPITVEYF